MSKLAKTFDEWLVHDEDCGYSLTDEPGQCSCIQRNVKDNLSRELKKLFKELVHSATKVSVEAEKELEGMIEQL
jgi:hypothetical protein